MAFYFDSDEITVFSTILLEIEAFFLNSISRPNETFFSALWNNSFNSYRATAVFS